MKVSIVGAAQIVKQYHLHALNTIKGVRISVVVDLKLSEAKSIARECGAKASTNLADVSGSDVVFIATPPRPRLGIIRNLPSDIKKIVVEKPVGLDMNDLEDIMSITSEMDIEVIVAQTRRYFLNLRLCSDLISSGLLGKIKEVHLYEGSIFNWISNTDHLYTSISPKDKGILQDVGSHLFDWLGMLLNKCNYSVEEFKATSCVADYRELSNTIEAEFKGPFKIRSKLSRTKLLSNTVKVVGEKGTLITRSLLDDKLKVVNSAGSYWIRTEFTKSQYSLEAAFVAMWEDFLFGKRVDNNVPSLSSVRAGMTFIDQTINEIEK